MSCSLKIASSGWMIAQLASFWFGDVGVSSTRLVAKKRQLYREDLRRLFHRLSRPGSGDELRDVLGLLSPISGMSCGRRGCQSSSVLAAF
jgi:hypothetical protein